MDKKIDDPIESPSSEPSSGLVYKIGSGIFGGVYGVASTSLGIVKSGSSMIYNNIPLPSWRSKPDENNNFSHIIDNDVKKSEEKTGWSLSYRKRKDKSD